MDRFIKTAVLMHRDQIVIQVMPDDYEFGVDLSGADVRAILEGAGVPESSRTMIPLTYED